MTVALGDVIGLQGIWMPSGFQVAVTPPPPVTVGGGPTRRTRIPRQLPAPTYHAIAVDSRIILIGSVDVRALNPLAVAGMIDLVGAASAAAVYLRADLRVSVMAALSVLTALAVTVLSVESAITIEGSVWAQQYNERDVRFVLGLPL